MRENPSTMAYELWDQLTYSLCQHNLCVSDLPQNEILLHGTLKELGFLSLVVRAMLRNKINQKLQETINNKPNKLPDPNNPAATFGAHYEKASDSPCFN